MNLPVNFLKTFLPNQLKNVKVETIDLLDIAKSTIEAINNAKEKTANNTGLKLIFAINYGGRAELCS